jgi:hypothetical protein
MLPPTAPARPTPSPLEEKAYGGYRLTPRQVNARLMDGGDRGWRGRG